MQRHATRPGTRLTPLLLLGLLTVAQPPGAVGRTRYVGAISSGDPVEVRLHGGEVLMGRFVRFDRNGLVLDVHTGERSLAAADIERVWWYHNRTRDFAAGGAIGGMTVGVTLTLLQFFSGGRYDVGATMLFAAAGGVLVGTLAGSVGGSVASDWEEVDMAVLTGDADIPRAFEVTVAPTVRQTGTALSFGLGISLTAPL